MIDNPHLVLGNKNRMEIRIENIESKRLIGKKITLSLSDNKTVELWQSFMPQRKEIKNAIGTELYSVQNYDSMYFADFNPSKTFEKWAAVEVADLDFIPEGMDSFTLPEGQYAVFHYKGLSSDNRIFQYIFGTWLPKSGYELDNRPHFEVLGEKYKNNDANSEEEIWIPIKKKI